MHWSTSKYTFFLQIQGNLHFQMLKISIHVNYIINKHNSHKKYFGLSW